jgi:uncharacterized membrane protein
MTKSKNFWKSLISTLWFVPMSLAVCGVILALALVAVDYSVGDRLGYFPRFFGVETSGSRDMLAIIAGSSITVAGTVFSITIVALTLASTQFSPRILRNFMRDTSNQVVLGVMVGIFAYCIIVLRTIRDSSGGGADGAKDFVPSIAIIFGVVLGLVGVGFLIFFIHHVATSIQATIIISQIAAETITEIEETFPVEEASPPPQMDEKTAENLAQASWQTVSTNKTGYIQNVDTEQLLNLARKHDLILKMQRRVGQFSVKGLPVLQIFAYRPNFSLGDNLAKALRETYDIGTYRTVEGDVAFGLRQIVDIALKALSPAINDTTTVITCIDYLTAILACLAERPSLQSYLFADDKLRLIVERQRFEDFFDLAFNQIRQSAGANVAVILRQLNSINILSKINVRLNCESERRERHDLMQTQAQLLYELAESSIKADADLQTVTRYFERVQKSLAEREIKKPRVS